MSTKIYNGHRIATDDIFAFTDRLRAVLDPVRDRLDARLIADKMTTAIDNQLFGLPAEDSDNAASRASEAAIIAHHRRIPVAVEAQAALMGHMFDQSKLRHEGKTGGIDYDPNRFELTIGRLPETGDRQTSDSETGDLLAITYCERDELTAAFRALDGVSEYSYWNNADEPDDVTAEEWDARRDAWHRVLGDDTPAQRMLSFTLRSDPGADFDLGASDPVHPLVLAGLPNIKLRARRLAQKIAMARLTSYLRANQLEFEFSMLFKLNPGTVAAAIEAVLPELDADFLARPLADLHRLMSDDQHAAVAQAVSTWWEANRRRVTS
ncbi:hypothetical protein GCG21_08740 [Pseudactinotalea sp. HY160]|uniref:hypothetical protein n=1 Tax=Pseudactinotalea sp. HY160 TaxID=2654490 RepID=UPI00128DB8A4|nr:hypothetical protein [Pseudactinotalea sp. HY160]MPV50091.1 hypothetical protein [Pseudactinotalea sp. HY160]